METSFIGLIVLGLIIASCNPSGKPKSFDYGHTENDKYLNFFLAGDFIFRMGFASVPLYHLLTNLVLPINLMIYWQYRIIK